MAVVPYETLAFLLFALVTVGASLGEIGRAHV